MIDTIACCYLTHNHPDTVRDVLSRSLCDYAVHGIDICVFDDSDNDETREVVNSFIQGGADNLFYVDAHAAKNADDKMLHILMGEGLPKKYPYIWPVKDRVFFSSALLDRLRECLKGKPDVVQIADEHERWDISRPMSNSVYHDPAAFYRDYNSYTVNWDGTLRKWETMLCPVNWDRYISDYELDGENFVHPLTLFARLAELDSCEIRICPLEMGERYIAPSGGNGWRSDVFGVWIDRWIRANYKLPAVYDPWKIGAIRQQTQIGELFASVDSMIEFRAEGIYDLAVYRKYEPFWPVVSCLPPQWLELIAEDRYLELFSKVHNEFESAIARHDHMWAQTLLFTNRWFDQVYDSGTLKRLKLCFMQYREDMLHYGKSDVFDGVDTITELLEKHSTELDRIVT